MNRKNVLVVGSGGREHAIAWSLARSLQTAHVFVAPGNAGTQWSANANPVGLQPRASSSNVPISADDFSALIKFAAANDIALTVIGPEIPLAQGIVDLFKKNSLPVFGPTQEAARLEASKQFAKDFMRREAIPTADYCYFHRIEDALKYLQSAKGPLVVKASGLAAGKGVILCENPDEAREAIRVIMAERVFGHAGDCVVIEERLTGQEMSLLAFSDGHTIVPMPPARDHKRIFDQDRGPNTGGMGVFTHPPDVDTGDVDEIIRTVLQPAITAMADRGTPYVGILYAGMIRSPSGWKTLEFNCRFGDPETQVILPLLKTDLLDILLACIEGRLGEFAIDWHPGACTSVVLASSGYPGDYPLGLPISGLENLHGENAAIAFHAGTAWQGDQIVTAGGRVLGITAMGPHLEGAVDHAYQALPLVHFENMHYRSDIGRVAT